jgi:hypothetical protein
LVKRSSAKTTPSPANPTRKLDILLHYRNSFGVDGAKIRVFEQVNQKGLSSFLERLDCMRLPSQLGANVCGEDVESNFADETREWQFSEEQVVGALVFADFFEGNGARFIPVTAAFGGWVAGLDAGLII